MRGRARRRWVLAGLVAAAAACRGNGAGADEQASTGSESGTGTDASSSGSSEDTGESEGDWGCEPPFCDTPPPIECGNGKVEALEECDGDVEHASCEDCQVVCDAGWWDCDGQPDDGCEVELATDTVNCGDCGHDCLGAACEDGLCQPVVLVEGEPAPVNVAVDATHVYWTNDTMAGSVVRATLDGEDRMVLGSATHPFDLALDDDDVFFSAEDSIRKVAKSGGASTPLITGTGATRGVALDATEVYYVDLALNDGDVERVSKGGGGELVLAPMQSSPRFLAVMDGLVYWTDDGAQTVSRTSVDGMGAVEPLASAQAGAWDVFATAELVVWTNLADVGEVKWLSLDDLMDERTLAFPVRPWGITVDDEYVYWTAEGDGTVQRSAVDGEQELAQVIADDQQQPHGIAVDGTFVYWADTQAGTIVRLTK